MSEHITHIAVYDDTVRLLQYSGRFTQAFKDSTNKEYDSGWIASGSNGNHIWAVPLLQEYREKYIAGDRSRDTLRKIAAAIGWITHRAADLVVKPILANVEFEKGTVFNAQEQSAYYDSIAFREVFKGGENSPSSFQPLSRAVLETDMGSHPASGAIDVSGFEKAFSHFYLDKTLNNHEFVAKQDNFDQWFDQFMSNKLKFSEDLDMYIEGFNAPKKEKVEKYINNFRYYNNQDSIIRLVRSIQNGNPDNSISLDVAMDAAHCQSAYTRMLQISCTMLTYASNYFDGKIEKSSLYDVLNMYGSERK